MIIDGLSLELTALRGDESNPVLVTAYPDPNDLAGADFLYRTDTILVRGEDLTEVLGLLGLSAEPLASRLPRSVEWLTVVALPPEQRWTEADDRLTAAESALVHIERELGPGRASFDRVVHLTSNSGCPATEPVPATGGPDPSVNADPTLGAGVTVAVIDSGWSSEDHVPVEFPALHWLRGVSGDAEPEAPAGDPAAQMRIGHYRGHGMFVAGVIRAMAPAADVFVHSWGPTTYGTIESELAPILQDVLDTDPDIISMSAGTGLSPADGSPRPDGDLQRAAGAAEQAAMSLDAFGDVLRPTKTLLVCAAGNDGNQGPFTPASSSWSRPDEPPIKVAVGGLKKDGRLAKWSNRGTWVDVYARGAKLVNAYPNGEYTYLETKPKGTTVTFTHRLATWSGTSFSTPLVAGLIAARLSWRDDPVWTARDAWVALRAKAAANAPFGLATLEPGDADRP
ncbi:S8 family peptidase [Humibacillus xanthopallidus]|nr:S8/S53 family peptidase [Humibacillus xanthopallidus]